MPDLNATPDTTGISAKAGGDTSPDAPLKAGDGGALDISAGHPKAGDAPNASPAGSAGPPITDGDSPAGSAGPPKNDNNSAAGSSNTAQNTISPDDARFLRDEVVANGKAIEGLKGDFKSLTKDIAAQGVLLTDKIAAQGVLLSDKIARLSDKIDTNSNNSRQDYNRSMVFLLTMLGAIFVAVIAKSIF
jgi:hypothetical protein